MLGVEIVFSKEKAWEFTFNFGIQESQGKVFDRMSGNFILQFVFPKYIPHFCCFSGPYTNICNF